MTSLSLPNRDKMEKQQVFFIQLLYDFLHEKETIIESDVDWLKIFHIADKQQLQAIVYYQCHDNMPESIKDKFRNAYFGTLYYYTNYKSIIAAISEEFEKNDILYITIKGLTISDYYPIPALRSMGDIDVLIKNKDRQEASVILQKKGFTIQPHVDNREWGFSQNGFMIELHDHLVYDDLVSNSALKNFFNNTWQYYKNGVLDISFHFIYILIHLRKHLMNCGVGFRQFLDIAMISKNANNLNWEWIVHTLNDLNLSKFASICMSFICEWFGVVTPIQTVKIDDEFYNTVTQTTFKNGVFGFYNTDNITNAAVNTARGGKNPQIEMIKSAIKFVFPPYNHLIAYDPYKFVERKPFLIPIAWLYRLFRGLKKTREGRRWLSLKFASKETISKRDSYLKKWGL